MKAYDPLISKLSFDLKSINNFSSYSSLKLEISGFLHKRLIFVIKEKIKNQSKRHKFDICDILELVDCKKHLQKITESKRDSRISSDSAGVYSKSLTLIDLEMHSSNFRSKSSNSSCLALQPSGQLAGFSATPFVRFILVFNISLAEIKKTRS